MKTSHKFTSLLFILLLSALTPQILAFDDFEEFEIKDEFDFEPEFMPHEDQDDEPVIIDVQEQQISESDRKLLRYPNLRIVVDYEHLTAGTDEFKTYVKTQLTPSVVSYLRSALQVKHPILTPIQYNTPTLCGFPTPKLLRDGVRGDVIVILYSKHEPTGGWMAATTSCAVSSGVKKPIVFKVGINTHSIGTADIDENPITHDIYINTLMHEFIHGLAMNGILYKYFIDNKGNTLTDHVKKVNIAGFERTVLDIEPLTTRLRNFYGCPTVPGIIMEQGSAHLERRYFQFEIMSTGGISSAKISEISLAFLEGTGWYIPNYSFAETYTFGQGQGCGFIYEECDAKIFDDEYCEGTGRGCLQVGSGGGYCKNDGRSESCRFHKPQGQFNCENPKGVFYTTFSSRQVYGRGLGSKCFSGNLTSKKTGDVKDTTYCLTYDCKGEGLNTKLEVNFGSDKFICERKGEVSLPGYRGQVNCPDPLTFCTTIGKKSCPKNCLGRGKCVNGKCECNEGYHGTDCGFSLMKLVE